MGDQRSAVSGQRSAKREPDVGLLAEAKAHLRVSVHEGIAAARSLADGASDLTERAIDRIARLLSNR